MWWLEEIDSLLRCPRCAGALRPGAGLQGGQGVLRCAEARCGTVYPVVDGIPRFLLDEERRSFLRLHWARLTDEAKEALRPEFPESLQWEGQKITMRSYDFQHANLYNLAYGEPEQAKKTLETVRRTFVSFYPLDGLKRARVALELGVGIGGMLRNLASESGAGTKIIGVDLTSSVDFAAKQFTAEELRTRVLLVQASVFQLPVRPGVADFVLSHGVLHHTPDPRRAFDELSARVSPEGEIHVWLYGDGFRQKHPVLYRASCRVRRAHSRLNPAVLWKLCAVYAGVTVVAAPLMRPIFPYRFPVRKMRRFWMDNLLNPFNFVYNDRELMGWKRPELERFEVESTGGAWTIHAARTAGAAHRAA